MRRSSATVLRRFLANLRSYLKVPDDSSVAVDLPPHAARDLLRFRAALDASSDAIFLVDVATMQFADTNFAATRMLGYTREQLLTMGPADLSKQSRARLHAKYDALILKRGKIETLELRLICKDRSRVPVELSRRPFRSDGKWHMICVARDISDARRAVRTMQKCELRYQAMFDFNPMPMWVYDLATLAFLAVNQAAVNKYGYTRDEFLGMTIADIRPAGDVDRLSKSISSTSGDFNCGTMSAIGASSASLPSSTCCMAAAAVIALVIDAIQNTVSTVIAGGLPISRRPKAPS